MVFAMTTEALKGLLKDAHDHGYAYPAINVSNLDTGIAAMAGLNRAKSAGFVQISIGAAKQASPTGDPVEGSIAALFATCASRSMCRSPSIPITAMPTWWTPGWSRC